MRRCRAFFSRIVAHFRLICSWEGSPGRIPDLAFLRMCQEGVEQCVPYPDCFSPAALDDLRLLRVWLPGDLQNARRIVLSRDVCVADYPLRTVHHSGYRADASAGLIAVAGRLDADSCYVADERVRHPFPLRQAGRRASQPRGQFENETTLVPQPIPLDKQGNERSLRVRRVKRLSRMEHTSLRARRLSRIERSTRNWATHLNSDEGAMDRRILVVDDSELICQQLSQLLCPS